MQLTADTRNPPFSFAGGRIHNLDTRESNHLAYLDLASKSSSSVSQMMYLCQTQCKLTSYSEAVLQGSTHGRADLSLV